MGILKPYYNTGTATLTNGSTTVTGQGTAWLSNLVTLGDEIVGADGRSALIASANSETGITLLTAWPGSNQTAGTYYIRRALDAVRMQETTRTLLTNLTDGFLTLRLDRPSTASKSTLDFTTGTVYDFRIQDTGNASLAVQRSTDGTIAGLTNVLSIDKATGVITASNAIREALGSAGAPSYSFNGDSDTGIYSPGANQVAMAAGGVERVTAMSSGVVVNGNLSIIGNVLSVYTAIQGTFPGLDYEDTDAGYTTHNRLRTLRNGSTFTWQTFSASAASLISTDLHCGITATGINVWSFRINGTQKFRIDSSGITAIGAYDATTANAANLNVASNGLFARSTSALKYKTDVEPADYEMLCNTIMAIDPIWYRSACPNDDSSLGWWGIAAESLAEIDPRFVSWRTVKEVEETYTERWPIYEWDEDEQEHKVTYVEEERTRVVFEPLPREEWEPEGVSYERLSVALIAMVQSLHARVEELENFVLPD